RDASAPTPAPEPPPAPPPDFVARLRALRARAPSTPEEIDAWYVALYDLVRAAVARRLEAAADARTSDELLAAAEASDLVAAPLAARLSALCAACDAVKFGGARPSAAERGRAADAAESALAELLP
ncbi:MAG TPA: hypothetical protein VEI02_08865, partial [Planctomycetota bacterium]|nr:hypothetical protein [Planctomycetota bacterium]